MAQDSILPNIRIASEDDRSIVKYTLTIGFSADPMMRWLWPQSETYLKTMPEFADAFGGRAFAAGSAYIADDGKAAALWLPPDVEPDGETMAALAGETVDPEKAEDVLSVMEQMDKFHPHDQPCWYLPIIAADPAYMGQGLGAALMKYALRRCDEEGMIAYLESSNARNISLYQRHGFEVIGEIQAGSSPTMYPMIRERA